MSAEPTASADPPVAANLPAPANRRWVVMRAAGQEVAIDAVSVREIHDDWRAVPLAGTAAWFLGTLVVRGRVMSVTSLDAWLDPGTGRPCPPFGVEITVGGDAYLLAVSDVRHAFDATPVHAPSGSPAGSITGSPAEPRRGTRNGDAAGALAARGVRVERRWIDGREMDCFNASSLVAAPAFGAIQAQR